MKKTFSLITLILLVKNRTKIKNIIKKLILNQINLKKKIKKSNHQKMKIKEDENLYDDSQKDENSNNEKVKIKEKIIIILNLKK